MIINAGILTKGPTRRIWKKRTLDHNLKMQKRKSNISKLKVYVQFLDLHCHKFKIFIALYFLDFINVQNLESRAFSEFSSFYQFEFGAQVQNWDKIWTSFLMFLALFFMTKFWTFFFSSCRHCGCIIDLLNLWIHKLYEPLVQIETMDKAHTFSFIYFGTFKFWMILILVNPFFYV